MIKILEPKYYYFKANNKYYFLYVFENESHVIRHEIRFKHRMKVIRFNPYDFEGEVIE